ncbi:MAG: 2-oxoglutarate dehydrogenase, E2 component, dihydrolipoamide succinyltransferase [Pyrinomonadaceae bacterium]
MSEEVVMPQMGESITEGTVSKWHKAVGDKIEKDETLLEISTDKIDAEVPSPTAGVLLEIRANEGDTVEVGSVVGVVGEAGEALAQSPKPQVPSQVETPKVEAAPAAGKIETDAANAQAKTVEATAEINANPENSGTATEVVMPQMGESITEGTVSKWHKAVGDKVEKDENLLEISTDKIDAAVPSPVAGVLLEIRANEGETVEVGSIVGLVGAMVNAERGTRNTESKIEVQKPKTEDQNSALRNSHSAIEMPAEEKREIRETEARSYDYGRPNAIADAQANGGSNGKSNGEMSLEDLRKTKSSPLVRNIAREHDVDISRIHGSGMSGRVTKKDILNFIDSGASVRPEDLLVKTPAAIPKIALPQVQTQTTQRANYAAPTIAASAQDRIEPMSVMRKKIAEHMTFSKQTSAHVTSVYEIDMTNVAKFRDKNKNDFQSRYGTKLTFMPFIFQTVTNALRKFPVVNAQVSGEQIIYKGDVNLGMAVALDWGLIVPVIKRADTLSLSGLALTANDLADRARTKKLMPDEVSGGTFTITNPGVFGGLFGTPIINQPQVAILCVGAIEKRAKVLTTADGDDYIAVRQLAYFALTYDHRIVDGADAEKFLSFMKEYLETTQFNL